MVQRPAHLVGGFIALHIGGRDGGILPLGPALIDLLEGGLGRFYIEGVIVVLRQHLKALRSGGRITDGDLLLNLFLFRFVPMPAYGLFDSIGSSSFSGHFLDASISVG